MSWGRRGALLLGGLVALGCPGPADAQAVLTRVFPNGGRQGSRVSLRLNASPLPDQASLLIEGEGVRPLGPVVKGTVEVEILPDATPGPRMLRLAGPTAGSTPRPFTVGTLPEFRETEPNNTRAQAQVLTTLPVTLNGELITRADLDLYRVHLRRGECLVVAGESRALGAPTNLLTRIRDSAGVELLVQVDSRTRDPLLGFTAPAEGDYFIEFQDVLNNYSNIDDAYVYRVTLTTGAWLDRAFPPVVERGVPAELTLLGWNLDGRPGLGSTRIAPIVPADGGDSMPVGLPGSSQTVPVRVLRTCVTLEGSPSPAAAPVTFAGIISARGERDRLRFTARAGTRYRLDVAARDLGSPLDAQIALEDGAGKPLGNNDDADGRDSRLDWTAPADGEYVVFIRDAANRGGIDYFYALTVAPIAPRLRLSVPDPTVVLRPGGKVEVVVSIQRDGPHPAFVIRADALPAGVAAAALSVPAGTGAFSGKLVLSADTATPGSSLIRLVADPGSVAATASWELSKDRSGTLATGVTDRLLLVIPTP